MGVSKRIILSVVLMLAAVLAQAQNNEEQFHEVQPGETKYGISRMYNISIETLEKYNPEIKDGLRAGVKLLIPEGQEEPEQDSEELAQDSGYVYHQVEMGHTLYSLARDYGTSIPQIRELNPNLGNDLKVGQRIKIPVRGKKGNIPEGDYYIHQVKPQETAYALSKLYQLSLDSLYLLNPAAEEGLQIGQKLRIPKSHVPDKAVKQQEKALAEHDSISVADTTAVADTTRKPTERLSRDDTLLNQPPETKSEDYFLYKVKTGDSFYSFEQKYNVEREKLLQLNPELKDGLKVGNYIIMPREKQAKEVSWLEKLFTKVEKEERDPLSRETVETKDSLNQPLIEPTEPAVNLDTVELDLDKNYRIALMLPFEAESLDSADYYDFTISGSSEMSLQFYQGLRLAADSISKSGMNITLNVYDTRQNLFRVKSLMDEVKRFKPDLIIGPAYKKNVEYVADELKEEGVPVLSPLSMAVDVKGRENLIQVVPDLESRLVRLADILNHHFQNAKVVFAHSGRSEDLEQVRIIKSRLKPRSDSSFLDNVVVGEENLTDEEALASLMNENGNTAVVVVGEDKVFINDVISKLTNLKDSSIFLVGTSRLMNMQTIENEYLNDLHLTMTDYRYTDFKNKDTRKFVREYRETYQLEPSGFAMQGYDLGLFFLQRLWKSGLYFKENLAGEEVKTATGFAIKRTDGGGYVNQYLFITGIRDFELVKIDVKDETQLQPLEGKKEITPARAKAEKEE